jgi:transcriptional regulator with XRE-family HTH domain
MKLSINSIEKTMAERGLTQRELAKRCAFSQPWLSQLLMKIRAGEEIRPVAVNKLAAGLGVEVGDLTQPDEQKAA